MKHPLKIIRDWFQTLPKDVRNGLAFDTIVRFLDYNPLGDRQQIFRDWLDAPLDYFHHVGRALSVCAVIDCAMQQRGDQQGWERSTDTLLNMIESDIPIGVKQSINSDLPDRPRRQTEWVQAAAGWRTLRSSSLSLNAINGWEQQMAQSPPSGPV